MEELRTLTAVERKMILDEYDQVSTGPAPQRGHQGNTIGAGRLWTLVGVREPIALCDREVRSERCPD